MAWLKLRRVILLAKPATDFIAVRRRLPSFAARRVVAQRCPGECHPPVRDGVAGLRAVRDCCTSKSRMTKRVQSQPTVMAGVERKRRSPRIVMVRSGRGNAMGKLAAAKPKCRTAETNYWQLIPSPPLCEERTACSGWAQMAVVCGGFARERLPLRQNEWPLERRDPGRLLDNRGVPLIGTAGGGLARWANDRVNAFDARGAAGRYGFADSRR